MRYLFVLLFVLLIVRPVRADDQPLYHASIMAALAAHGADLATTEYCLGNGGCHETNAFLLHFSNQPAAFGATKMAGAAVGLWAASKIPNKKVAAIVNFSIAAAFSYVAYHNTQVINR